MVIDTSTYTALIGLGSAGFGALGMGLGWLANRQNRIAVTASSAADVLSTTQARVTALEVIAESNYRDRERLSAENLTLQAKMQDLEDKLDTTVKKLDASEALRTSEAQAAKAQIEELTKRIAELMAKLEASSIQAN